jgi:TorA maturation chaperone TorD
MISTTAGALGATAAGLLSQWWSRPVPSLFEHWNSPGFARETALLWNALNLPAASLEQLLTAIPGTRQFLESEYESLFVGPAAIACPPYEAVWRQDRPKMEQGTVFGESTAQVKSLYLDLGLQVNKADKELPDHLAVEWEALAYALSSGNDEVCRRLLQDHLAVWLPPFCAAVQGNARLDFYRRLAALTLECLNVWQSSRS